MSQIKQISVKVLEISDPKSGFIQFFAVYINALLASWIHLIAIENLLKVSTSFLCGQIILLPLIFFSSAFLNSPEIFLLY